jgi:hypothetical protein
MVPGTSLFAGAALQLSVDPVFISEQTFSAIGTTDSVTVSTSGGAPTYTYAWTRVSGSSEITAGSASAATTDFDFSFTNQGFFSATFRCTVTDSASITETIDVSVNVFYGNFS